MKRKILLVHHVSSIGGSGNQFYYIVKSLHESKKYEIQIVLKFPGEISKKISALGLNIHFLNDLNPYPYCKSFFQLNFYVELFKCLKSYSSFKNYMRNIDYDLVYFNSLFFFYLTIIPKKSILHIRENWHNKFYIIQKFIIKLLVKRNVSGVIYINNTLKSLYNFPIQSDRIYDFIEVEKFSNLTKSINAENNLLYPGGISEIKGIYEISNSLSDLKETSIKKIIILGAKNNLKKLRKGFKGKLKDILNVIGFETKHDKIINAIYKVKNQYIFESYTNKIEEFYAKTCATITYVKFPHALLSIPESLLSDNIVICKNNKEAVEYSFGSKNVLLLNNKNELKNILKLNETRNKKIEKKVKESIIKNFSYNVNHKKINLFVERILNR